MWGRGKEAHILDLPNGILTFAETHLSSVSLPKSTSFLRSAASRLQRRLRALPGLPVSLRPNSQVAGVWSGILHLSDLGCHPISFPWPGGEFQMGRVHTSKFFLQNKAILGCTAYGWPTSPSWPPAKKATAEMLSQLGLWESHGWVEVQSLWLLRSGDPIRPTCKGRTRPDRIYLSPELAAWFVSFELRDVFADHSTLIATLQVACDAVPRMRWPVTTKIPWTSVDLHS